MNLKSSKIIVCFKRYCCRWVGYWVVGLGLLPCAGVWANTWKKADCVGLFEQKKFSEAGVCFERVGLAMGDPVRLPVIKRYEKGLLLRNAAIAWHRAASESIQVDVAAYLHERAVQSLQRYRQEKLCETTSRCRSALDLESQLVGLIGYAQLTVVVHEPNAQVLVRGYEYRLEKSGDVSIRVRPGSYQIQVVYSKAPPDLQRRLVQIVAKTSMIQSFFPAGHKPRPISKLSVGLYSAGAITLASGGVLLGVGGISWVSAENQWFNPSAKMSIKDELVQQRQMAQPLFWSGVGAIGVGALLMVLGGVFHRSTPLPPTKVLPPAGGTTPLSSGVLPRTLWTEAGGHHAF